jgi:hypothetical protein
MSSATDTLEPKRRRHRLKIVYLKDILPYLKKKRYDNRVPPLNRKIGTLYLRNRVGMWFNYSYHLKVLPSIQALIMHNFFMN